MRAVVANGDTERGNEFRRILLNEGLICDPEGVVEYGALPECLAAAQPDLVLIGCNGSSEAGLKAIRTAHQLVTGHILAVGEPGVTLVRDAMRAGACEFLDVDNLRQDLSAALIHLENTSQIASKRGKLIGVYSPVAGVGVSTIAINLAAVLVRQRAQGAAGSVALLDITPAPSEMSLLLDLQPKYTLTHVCRHPERLDRKLLAGAMTAHPTGLHILPQAGFGDTRETMPGEIEASLVRQLFVLLRLMYEFVVVDIGHSVSSSQAEVMQMANVVIVLVSGDVPSLRKVRWALDVFEEKGVPRDRFQLVLNRSGSRGQVKQSMIEESLNMKLLCDVPDDPGQATRARNEGVPLVGISGMSKVSSSFTTLAKHVQRILAGAVS